MNPTRVLYVANATVPFLDIPPLSKHVNQLSEAITISPDYLGRLLLPRFGVIDERTNSIYEMIRLSGINIPMGKDPISLVAKVPSIRGVKTPIYFIDNEKLFGEVKGVFNDKQGKFYDNNDVRMIFFCKSVLEIIVKLPWIPHIIHCHGWMTSLLPYYIKKAFTESHPLRQTKCIYTLYDDAFNDKLTDNFFKNVRYKQVKTTEVENLMKEREVNYQKLTNLAITHADKVTRTFDSLSAPIWKEIPYQDTMYVPIDEKAVEIYKSLYKSIISNG